MLPMDSPRVLSIQSHVVSGYVGNKSAVFPLQVLGFEVDSINSVQFSNHTGYDSFEGQVLDDTQLMGLYKGLQDNHINHYSHLLTGYVASDSFLKSIAQIVADVKTVNPHLTYVCDPVLGDDDVMYVPTSLIDIYKEEIIPLSDVVTPNQFEAELLTGVKIYSIESAREAIERLHSMGPSTVVLTSCHIPLDFVENHRHDHPCRSGGDGVIGGEGQILSIASKHIGGRRVIFGLEVPMLASKFTGSGDLFAALFLAWNQLHGEDLKLTLETVASTMHTVLQKTLESCPGQGHVASEPLTVRQVELKLVQCKKQIEEPHPIFKAFAL